MPQGFLRLQQPTPGWAQSSQAPQGGYGASAAPAVNPMEMFMAILKMQQEEERYTAKQALATRELDAQIATNQVQSDVARANIESVEDERMYKALENAQLQIHAIEQSDMARSQDVDLPAFLKSQTALMQAGGKSIRQELGGLADIVDPTVQRTREFNVVDALRNQLTPNILEKVSGSLNKALESGDKVTAYGIRQEVENLLGKAGGYAAEDPELLSRIVEMRNSISSGLGDFGEYSPLEEVSKFQETQNIDMENKLLEYQAGLNTAKLRGPESVLSFMADLSQERLRSRQQPKPYEMMGPPAPTQKVKFNPVTLGSVATSLTPDERVMLQAQIKPREAPAIFSPEPYKEIGRRASEFMTAPMTSLGAVDFQESERFSVQKAALKRAAATLGRKGYPSPERTRGVGEEAERIKEKARNQLMSSLMQSQDQSPEARARILQAILGMIEKGQF